MALFDRIKQVAGQVADTAQRQVEIMQDQGKIARLQEEIDKNLIEAGKRARELVRTRKLADADLALTLTRIESLEAEIEEVRNQVQALQQGGTAAPPAAADAGQTGPPQVITANVAPTAPPPPPSAPPATASQPPAEAQASCPSCGAKVAQGAKFCAGCGARLEA